MLSNNIYCFIKFVDGKNVTCTWHAVCKTFTLLTKCHSYSILQLHHPWWYSLHSSPCNWVNVPSMLVNIAYFHSQCTFQIVRQSNNSAYSYFIYIYFNFIKSGLSFQFDWSSWILIFCKYTLIQIKTVFSSWLPILYPNSVNIIFFYNRFSLRIAIITIYWYDICYLSLH